MIINMSLQKYEIYIRSFKHKMQTNKLNQNYALLKQNIYLFKKLIAYIYSVKKGTELL
jgi:hypothetical protein